MEGPAGSGIEDVSFGSVDPFLEAIKKQLADPDLAGNPLLGSYRKLVERYEQCAVPWCERCASPTSISRDFGP